MKFIVPERLKLGDKVAIVSPSSACPFLYPHIYELGLERLRSVFGLEPVEFPSTKQSPDYLSQHPEARAADINTAFADKSIKAIIATIGGTDCFRILHHLDKNIITNNPKIFMGYSDITNIHLFLYSLGIVSYYGGSLMNQFGMHGAMHEYTVNSIKSALFEKEIGLMNSSPVSTDCDYDCDIPVIFNLNFGHTDPHMIVPNGGKVSIDGKTRTLRFGY